MDHQCDASMPPRQPIHIGSRYLSVVDWGGNGPPALLLHGITSNAYAWWRVAPMLAARGMRVISLDMPGHGESDLPEAHQLSAIADLVCGTIADLELHDLTLIGHSWGGATALTLASGNDPARDMLRRVVLLDPAMAMSPEWGEQTLPRYLDGVGEPETVTAPRIADANPDWHACDVYWKAKALAECRPAAVRGFFTESGTWQLTEQVAQIEVPLAIFLADARHTVVPVAAQAALREHLPSDALLATIPEANHNLFRGRYEATVEALGAWLVATNT